MPRTAKVPSKKNISPGHQVADIDLLRHTNMLRNMMASSLIDQLTPNASTGSSRSMLARRLGYEYQGDRDVYTALGYSKTIIFEDYFGKYQRGDIARRIVRAPVAETWRNVPIVNEVTPEGGEKRKDRTEFEKAWSALTDDKGLKVWNNLRRADLVSGIGRWGGAFLGFSDAASREDFAKPVEQGTALKLMYITPLNESQMSVSTMVSDPTDSRFNQPEFYELKFQNVQVLRDAAVRSLPRAQGDDATSVASVRVHWTRMLHIAEEPDENLVVGTPRLRAVYNKLLDLDRVVGSSGEAFWRNAFPGLQFKLDDDSQYSDKQSLDELKTQVDGFVHNWERYIRTKGVSIEQLSTSVASPKDSFQAIISIIAGATSIPQRILLGSERGELASSQDQTQWAVNIEERREQHVEPNILDQFILRLVLLAILPSAPNGWKYVWPDLLTPSEKERAEVASKRTEALVKYADSINASGIVPLNVFLRSEKFLNFSEEEAVDIEKVAEALAKEQLKAIEDENRQITDDDAVMAAEGEEEGVVNE